MEITTMSQIMQAIAQFILSGTQNPTLHTWFPEREVFFCDDAAMAEPPRRSRRPGEPSPSLAATSSATPTGAAAVLERLRGPIRWISDTRTVKLEDQLREALREVGS
jgi:hypothetical protein